MQQRLRAAAFLRWRYTMGADNVPGPLGESIGAENFAANRADELLRPVAAKAVNKLGEKTASKLRREYGGQKRKPLEAAAGCALSLVARRLRLMRLACRRHC